MFHFNKTKNSLIPVSLVYIRPGLSLKRVPILLLLLYTTIATIFVLTYKNLSYCPLEMWDVPSLTLYTH